MYLMIFQALDRLKPKYELQDTVRQQAAKSFAVSCPMPEPDPVMRVILPCSRMVVSLGEGRRQARKPRTAERKSSRRETG